MTRLLRVYRVTGDSLSCRFAPEGALATAVLTVDGKDYLVAGQLPGLRDEDALAYLGGLGYRPVWESWQREVGVELNDLLEPLGAFVEAVGRDASKVLHVALIEQRDRILACPRRLGLLRYPPASGVLEALDAGNPERLERIIGILSSANPSLTGP